MQRQRIRRMARIGLCAALMSVCAWISVPSAVPFTLQSFAVLLAAALLPRWDALCSVLVYLALGLVGLPIFSGMQGGVGVFLGPTGGFLLGFAAAAVCMRLTARFYGTNFFRTVLCMLLSQCVCYAFGSAWFSVQSGVGLSAAVSACVLPYLLPDAVKTLLAAWLAGRLRGALNR